jgi:hypothetical protein
MLDDKKKTIQDQIESTNDIEDTDIAGIKGGLSEGDFDEDLLDFDMEDDIDSTTDIITTTVSDDMAEEEVDDE